ncbi:MAG: hypothetical protein OEX12_11455 [Gammaproteobacteria bacterium]|nr:hypothetical protein [Gammaproteobacteria bacterium]
MKAFWLLMALVVLSAGCSNEGDSNTDPVSSSVTLAGVVSDGYISGATICLDVNSNMVCEANEPSTTSGSDGQYSLSSSEFDVSVYPVIAEVKAGAIDADSPDTPITMPYTMSTPAGHHHVVSPLTTLVDVMYRKYPAAGISGADSNIKQLLGYTSDDAVSMFDDYIAGSEIVTAAIVNSTPTTAATYARLRNIARATARAIANNTATVTTALGDTGTTDTQSAITDIVVSQIAEDLTLIAGALDEAVTVDKTAIDTAAAISIVDTTNIVAEVAASLSTADIIPAPVSELNNLYVDLQGCGSCVSANGTPYTYDYGKISLLDGVFINERYGVNINTTEHILLSTGRSDEPMAMEILNSQGILVPVTNSRVELADGYIYASFLGAAGSALSSAAFEISADPVAGENMKNITVYHADRDYPHLDGTETFPAGSVIYPAKRRQITEQIYHDTPASAYFPGESLSNLVVPSSPPPTSGRPEFSASYYYYDSISGNLTPQDYRYQLVGDINIGLGSVYLYSQDLSGGYTIRETDPVKTGTWILRNTNGNNVLIVRQPHGSVSYNNDAYIDGSDGVYKLMRNLGGYYTGPDTTVLYNQIAFNAMLSAAGLMTIP